MTTDPGIYAQVGNDSSHYRPRTPDELYRIYGITVPGYVPAPVDKDGNETGPATWHGKPVVPTKTAHDLHVLHWLRTHLLGE